MAADAPVLLALTLGATFVARSFSGDKKQLVPILKAGLAHRGFAIVDVISPCVSFNDHEGSTKSYAHTRAHGAEEVHTDFVPLRREITLPDAAADVSVVQMHDGSSVRLRSGRGEHDPTDRAAAYAHVAGCNARGEIATGLLFLDESGREMHDHLHTVPTPLVDVPYAQLCPGSAALDALMTEFR